MKDQALTIPSNTISKKEVKALAVQIAAQTSDPLSGWILATKYEELAKQLKASLSPMVLEMIGSDEELRALEATVTAQGGGFVFSGERSYGHNPAWVEAVARVKEIEAQMKAAAKNKFTVSIDSETGEDIPPAKETPRKPYLKILY